MWVAGFVRFVVFFSMGFFNFSVWLVNFGLVGYLADLNCSGGGDRDSSLNRCLIKGCRIVHFLVC